MRLLDPAYATTTKLLEALHLRAGEGVEVFLVMAVRKEGFLGFDRYIELTWDSLPALRLGHLLVREHKAHAEKP